MRRSDLQRDQDRRVRREAEVCQVFAVEVEPNSLLQIAGHLIQCHALSDDGDLEALCDPARFLARSNDGLDRPLQRGGRDAIPCLAIGE